MGPKAYDSAAFFQYLVLIDRCHGNHQICVVLYKNVEMAVGINSAYTKRQLQSLHPTIAV